MLKRYIDYLNDNPKGYWFKAKIFGWGWTPVTWQGWVVTLIYVGLLILFAQGVEETSSGEEMLFGFFLPAGLATGAFIYIAYKKGEKPSWRWGWPKE